MQTTPPTLSITVPDVHGKLLAILSAMQGRNVRYSPDGETPGWKPKSLAMQANEFVGRNIDTGDEGPFVDCSGYSGYCLWHLTGGGCVQAGGSVQQHEWCVGSGFEPAPAGDGHKLDGALRIAFLPPIGRHAGHVLLIVDGMTFESHGGVGPASRPWGSEPFMGGMRLYRL